MIKSALVPIAFAVSSALSQTAPKSPWTELEIKSAKLGETRTVLVATPADYANPNRRFPVLVLLDADDRAQFTSAVANVAFLADRAASPELIVVGVTNGKDRSHDLTPVATGATAKQLPTAGGVSRFMDFVTGEMLPEIRAKYRTQPATFLAGHSFGGLVALHAASTSHAFTGIIAMSPSLWWNDSTAARGYADSLEHLTQPLRLFASSGEFEPAIAIPTRRFAARLDSVKPTSLRFLYRHYSTDNHLMTPLHSLIDGLIFVFQPVSMVSGPFSKLGPNSDSAAVMQAYTAARQSFADGARSLGLTDTNLPEGQTNQLGYVALQFLKLPRLATWLFEQNVHDYPKSPNAHDSLGDGLLARGDTTRALEEFRRALAVAKEVNVPPSRDTQKKLADLEKKSRTR